MKNKKQEEIKISLKDAEKEVELVSKRLALLHLCYGKTIIEEMGEKKGKKMILKAIKKYGLHIGEKTKQDIAEQKLKPIPENFTRGFSLRIPKFGMHEKIEETTIDGEKRLRVHECAMGKLWKDLGEEELGKLYCYVDPIKYMGYNKDFKLIHRKMLIDGDDFCELKVEETSDKEKEDLFSDKVNWMYID